MINFRILRSGLALGAAMLALAGCQIDTRTPIRTSQIMAVATSGAAQPVNVALTGTFASEGWCQDEGAMAIQTLSSPAVPVQAVSCTPAGKHAVGQFQVTTSLVRTAGGPDDATILENVLGNDTARFAVFPHGKHKGHLSVGLFLNLPKLAEGEQKLLAMPVFKRGKDTGQLKYSFTVDVMNDLDKPMKFYLGNVSAGGDLPADEAVLTIPAGGMDTITLDDATQQQLMQNGWVNFFVMQK
jgi:hypothetical protein